MEQVEHRCLPRSAILCQTCGGEIAPPEYCAICGEMTTPPHVCPPRPLPHVCGDIPAVGRCVACGEHYPAAQYCVTCGADITPSHRCSADPPTKVHRADPIHTCPALKLPRCSTCNQHLPAMTFCAQCGVETTAPHQCPPQAGAHTCAPVVTMPKRCPTCGEIKPQPQHCTQCGTDLTPEHQCAV